MSVKGLQVMLDNLAKIANKYPDAIKAALYQEAQILMTEAKRRTPVGPVGKDRRHGEITGALRASGRVGTPQQEGKRIFVVMSFGGAAIDYALAVHEHLSEHSPHSWVVAETSGSGVHWTQSGTGPKFLEGPINEAQPTMAARIAERVHLSKLSL